LHHH